MRRCGVLWFISVFAFLAVSSYAIPSEAGRTSTHAYPWGTMTCEEPRFSTCISRAGERRERCYPDEYKEGRADAEAEHASDLQDCETVNERAEARGIEVPPGGLKDVCIEAANLRFSESMAALMSDEVLACEETYIAGFVSCVERYCELEYAAP